jgi:hypothetical protein
MEVPVPSWRSTAVQTLKHYWIIFTADIFW